MQVGQHVVYVGNSNRLTRTIKPVKGKVYTVRELWVANDGMPCLYVQEITNRHVRGRYGPGREIGYKRESWRPLSPRRLDIFTEMLVKEPENV